MRCSANLPGSKAAQAAREGESVNWEVSRYESLPEALEASEAVFANDIWWPRDVAEATGAVLLAREAQSERKMAQFFEEAPERAKVRRDCWNSWLADKALNPWHAAGPDYYEAEQGVAKTARKCEEATALLPVRKYFCNVSKEDGEPEARIPLPRGVMEYLGEGACVRAPHQRARQVSRDAVLITGLWTAVSGAGWDAGILSAGAIGLAFEEAGYPAPDLRAEKDGTAKGAREETPFEQERRMRQALRKMRKNPPKEKPKNKKIGSH